MAGLLKKSFETPEERRPFTGKGYVDIVRLGDRTIGRGYYEPGWRWSEHLKPIAGTDSCQIHHVVYMLTGRMAIRMNDGTEAIAGPGDMVEVLPGHDAWVVGDEACSLIDVAGMAVYAKPTATTAGAGAGKTR
jgi:hypothetical protein